MTESKLILKEIAAVFAGVSILTVAITLLQFTVAAEYVSVLVAILFLGTALAMADRDTRLRRKAGQSGEPTGSVRFGIDLAGVLSPGNDERELGLRGLVRALRRGLSPTMRETGFAVLVAVCIFPPFALGFELFFQPTRPFSPAFISDQHPFTYFAGQLLLVGLPEEALFRGYFQTRLRDLWKPTLRILGADISLPALLISSALFALIHFLVDLNPMRLGVFFPALLFGWLRARRGGIGAAIVFHALSNFYNAFLSASWL